MIHVKYNGRMGNNLFQFAMGKILAEELDQGIDSYKGQFSDSILCDGIIQSQTTSRHTTTTLTGNIVNLDSKPPGDIILDGYFQRSEYYLPHRDKIKQWFALPESDFEPNEKDIILHIRRSDFGWDCNNGMLPLAFYGDILENGDYDKVYITGGCSHAGESKDIDNQVLKYFEKYNPIYVDESPIDTFRMIKKFKTVVQSMSTFCWWACFLSDDVKQVYTPIVNEGYWTKDGDVDLRIDNDKYIYIDNIDVEKF